MNYLEQVKWAYSQHQAPYGQDKAWVACNNMINNEKLSQEHREKLIEFRDRINNCSYYNHSLQTVDNSKWYDFICVTKELYQFLDSTFIFK